MDVDIEAKVLAGDGRKVGKVTRVVVDPASKKVVDLIVEHQKGLLDVREIVVPTSAVVSGSKGEVHLNISPEDLEKLPDFIETEYVAPPPNWYPPAPLPPGGILWPAGYGAMFVQSERRNVPAGMIALNEDTEVYCTDGRIGVVDEVISDEAGRGITGFVVRAGTFLTHDVLVPIDWVTQVLEDRVVLNRSKADVAGQRERAAGA